MEPEQRVQSPFGDPAQRCRLNAAMHRCRAINSERGFFSAFFFEVAESSHTFSRRERNKVVQWWEVCVRVCDSDNSVRDIARRFPSFILRLCFLWFHFLVLCPAGILFHSPSRFDDGATDLHSTMAFASTNKFQRRLTESGREVPNLRPQRIEVAAMYPQLEAALRPGAS